MSVTPVPANVSRLLGRARASQPAARSAREWLSRLEERLRVQQDEVAVYEAYFVGDHPLRFATDKFKQVFGNLFGAFSDNWNELIVLASVERLAITGFRQGGDDGNADQDIWKRWQENNLDNGSVLAHTEAVKTGRAYILVNSDGRMSVEHPAQVVVAHLPGDRRQRLAALKKWIGEDGHAYANVYLPTEVVKFRSKAPQTEASYTLSQSTTTKDQPASDGWELNPKDSGGRHGFGVVPVIPLYNNPGMLCDGTSDLRVAIPLTNAINKQVLDMMVASEFQAFRQRVLTGVELPKDPETGQPLASAELKAAVSRLWSFESSDAKVTELSGADLTNYVKPIEMLIQHLAAQTRTPPHYLLSSIVNAPLALDTVVPVPGGRSTMGDLKAGDEVYAPDGTVQKVTGTSPVFFGRNCYRVEFSDGTEVVADSEHRWETTHFTRPEIPYAPGKGNERFETSVVTTAEIAKSLKTGMGTNNHFVGVARPYPGAETDFPIDPYVLGAWLGDGCRWHGTITSHVADCDEMAGHIHARGEHRVEVREYPASDLIHGDTRTLKVVHDRSKCARGHTRTQGTKCATCEHLTYRQRRYGEAMPERTNTTLRNRLVSLNLYRNKHIPEAYFHGSVDQRLALLQGLMDTDGTVNVAQGSVSLALHDERLARDAFRLIQSLGHKVALTEKHYNHKKFGKGVAWGMHWSAPDPVFRLKRKAVLQKTDIHPIASRRYIVACQPIESVPVKCISVSSDARLFCITDALIATHNSGDALKSAEAGLVSKVEKKILDFSDPWEEAMRLSFRATGDTKKAEATDLETIWADPEKKSEAEKVDAAQKLLALDVPHEIAWERAGLSPKEIEKATKALPDTLAQKAAQNSPGARTADPQTDPNIA